MNIGFWDNQLSERGSSTAVFDYAYFNQTLLGNKSFIFYEESNCNNDKQVIQKFNNHFTVNACKTFEEVDTYIQKYNIEILYIIKSGQKDNKLSKIAKNFVHCIFNCKEPHGDIYASISDVVEEYDYKYPVLPHMINIPDHNENMRKDLNIPEDAIVFGRYGGKEQFDVHNVQMTVQLIAQNYPNIYFLFANTNFSGPKTKNIILLDKVIDLHEKRKFINTCDAMLWARSDGETFGLAIGEFSTCNKPIIAYFQDGIGSFFHIKTLRHNAYWYKNALELFEIIMKFDKNKVNDWNMYKDYTPEKVMKIFKELVIDRLKNT